MDDKSEHRAFPAARAFSSYSADRTPSRGWMATESKGVRTVRHFRPSGGDTGAAAVEFALLFPIFVLLTMGTITVGTAFSRQINVTQAAREASRYGATLDISTLTGADVTARTDTWLGKVDAAADTAAGGANNYIGGYDLLCVALVVTDSTGAATTGSRYLTHGGSAANGACPSTNTAAIPSTKYVQVVFARKVQFFAVFINAALHVDAVSTTPYERTVG
jgi:Flp pilus assembly protein TadG